MSGPVSPHPTQLAGDFPAGVAAPPVPAARIIRLWWPLAASWVLMAVELPALSAVAARLPHPEINLAAFGGVIFPLSLIIESPVIMLLAASVALSKDRDAYRKIRRFMMVTGASLTLLHMLVAFTPLYDVVVRGILGAPAEIVGPARLGLMIMTPWSWSIGYRRFNQGVLIRFGHSRVVGLGTVVRLTADSLILAIGYLIGTVPGAVVAASALALGVLSEAIYTAWRVRPVLNHELYLAPPAATQITLRSFLTFYIPLVMTSLLSLLTQPIGSAALSRMPEALASLATWPVLTGLIYIVRNLGVSYNEVVVALLDEPGALQSLRRFAFQLCGGSTALLLIITATPFAGFWFAQVSALPPALTALARSALWIGVLIPGISVFQSWYQGTILHSRHTRGITESVVISLLVNITILVAGVASGQATGLYFGITSIVVGAIAQVGWLWYRSRPAFRALRVRQQARPPALDATEELA